MTPLPLIFVFALSGASALLFETLWFHQAGLALGNSIWASSLVLASFMGGLAVGNGLVARLGSRIERPVRLYAALELVIGIAGLSLVYLLPRMSGVLGALLNPFVDTPLILNSLRIGVGFAALLIPATAMGATLPILVGALSQRDAQFGRVLGTLYGWNTLGAVAGSLLGTLFTIERWGISGSAYIACSMNIAAAAVAMATAGRVQTSASRPGERVGLTRRAWLLLGAAFLSGGILLGLEVIWFRFGLLFIRGDDIGFAVMLATVLAGIGLGGLMAGRALAWRQGTTNGSTAIALLCGALVITLYKSLGTFLGPTTLYTPVFYGLFMMFPVALMSGALFPLLGEALNRELHAEMRSAGLLTLANTFGAMIGPLLAAFVLLPELGIELSMRLLAAAYGGVALLCLAGGAVPGSKPGAVLLGLTAAAMLYSVVVFPTGLMKTHYISRVVQANDPDHTYRTVAIREGLTETIIYLQADAWGRPVNHRMLTNSYSMSATNLSGLRYMRLYVQLPVAIHADMRSALLISYGVGTTAKALTDTRSFERIDMVDISRDVFEMNDIVYPDPATHPLGDPRVHVHIDDGRYYLQTTQRRYDLITGEPPPPKMAGVVNLYTREYFELVRSRLAEGGITTYWLPVHSLEPGDAKAIIRGFCDAFDDCTLWGGAALNWMLVGTRDAQGPVSREAFSRQWSDAVVGPQLRDVGIEAPAQLGSLFMAGADDLRELTADTPPLIDDYPLRLSHTASSVPHLNEVFWPWMETEVAAERFLTSELVKRLWPGELLVESLAWFDVQAALNHVLMQRALPRSEKLAAIDRALANPSLRSLPLLQMGGGPVQERAALAAWEDGDRGIELRYHRALGAIADRDFALAADLLAVVRPTGHRRPWTVIYEIYSLCRAGRKERATQLLRQVEIEIELWEVLSDVCARPAR